MTLVEEKIINELDNEILNLKKQKDYILFFYK